jgi:DNA-directed RNA polymerase specialized sigma24 family protein
MVEQRIIDGLSRSDNTVIAALYHEYRDRFISLGFDYGLSETEGLDIFHDSLIILRNHAIKGNLNKVQHQLSTYFITIGKYRVFDYLKKRGRSPMQLVQDIPEIPELIDAEWDESVSEYQATVLQSLNTLKPACKKMLMLFYFEGLSIEEIVSVGKYENANVVRAQKSRCLKILKERIHEKRIND